VPGAFHFTLVRDEKAHKGMILSGQRLFTDSGPIVGALMKRGMLSAEDFGKMAAA
jgi:hypothetical protein